jgi:hypothetical protein
MSKQVFYLANPINRANAVQAVRTAPDGYRVEIKPKGRSLDQSAMFHAICGELEKLKVQWAGKARDASEWKVLLVSGHTTATKGETEIVPGLEGEFINIRESTAKMDKQRGSSLIEYATAFLESKRL